MVGLKRLRNLRHLITQVLDEGIPGDFIETGVWRGGACIYMRALLMVYGVKDRRVWVAELVRRPTAAKSEAIPGRCRLELAQDSIDRCPAGRSEK